MNWRSIPAQETVELTGCVTILDRPLILRLWPQNASSNSQSQLRGVYLITLISFGVIDEAILGGKPKPSEDSGLNTHYFRCLRTASNTNKCIKGNFSKAAATVSKRSPSDCSFFVAEPTEGRKGERAVESHPEIQLTRGIDFPEFIPGVVESQRWFKLEQPQLHGTG